MDGSCPTCTARVRALRVSRLRHGPSLEVHIRHARRGTSHGPRTVNNALARLASAPCARRRVQQVCAHPPFISPEFACKKGAMPGTRLVLFRGGPGAYTTRAATRGCSVLGGTGCSLKRGQLQIGCNAILTVRDAVGRGLAPRSRSHRAEVSDRGRLRRRRGLRGPRTPLPVAARSRFCWCVWQRFASRTCARALGRWRRRIREAPQRTCLSSACAHCRRARGTKRPRRTRAG